MSIAADASLVSLRHELNRARKEYGRQCQRYIRLQRIALMRDSARLRNKALRCSRAKDDARIRMTRIALQLREVFVAREAKAADVGQGFTQIVKAGDSGVDLIWFKRECEPDT